MTAKDDTERSADSTIRPEDADPDEGLDTATGRVAGGAAVAGTAVNGLVAAILPTSLVPSTHLWELAYYIDRYRSHSHRIYLLTSRTRQRSSGSRTACALGSLGSR